MTIERPSIPPARTQPVTDTALFLDVDGVFCPLHSLETDPAWGPTTIIDDPGFGELAISLDMAAALVAAPVELMWCTDWQDIANMAFASYLGQSLPHLTRPREREDEWWKLDAVRKYLRENPHIRRVVWIDDHLSAIDEDDDDWVPRSAQVTRELEARGIRALLIAPLKTIGFTKADWNVVLGWLRL
ncbi:HAD domain-containing protein [Frondihabitans australicus]|uniref:Deoxypyrimidine-specific 5' nucleotidase type C protein (NT5C) n=1 Tax=Frondihabitans australicus TaxID=386892 RepID=A0A495IJK2_9MICO|nr:HAD domain-containing protein [Frondihabitans australicus]RKR75900.1 hypothetical protein C8E83_3064 [Frondihabitans australicus]